jgi:hypothetical protein
MQTQEEHYLELVKFDGLRLKGIKKQTDEIALAAVSREGMALEYVKKQSHEIALAAVSKNGNALRFVDKQTAEIALAAVINYPKAFEYVKVKTLKIILAAVSRDGFLLKHVVDQTPEIILAAVTQDGSSIKYASEQTQEIILAAIAASRDAIRYVKIQNPEIALAAVIKNPFAISCIEDQTTELSLAAVSVDGFAIKYIKNQTDEIIFTAWKQIGDDLFNYSCNHGLTIITDLLLKNNIDINHVSTRYPLTAFQQATINSNLQMMASLHKHGADIHIRTPEFQRNIMAEFIINSSYIDNEKVISTIVLLLEMGISPKDTYGKGRSAILLVKKKPEIMHLFKAFEIKKLIESTIKSTQDVSKKKKNTF